MPPLPRLSRRSILSRLSTQPDIKPSHLKLPPGWVLQSAKEATMAKRITAIQALTPRIELQGRFVTETMCDLISRRTSLNRGEIENVLRELDENMADALSTGRPVKLNGIGTLTPVIRLNGEFSVNVRVDRELIKDLNKPGRFTGGLRNRPNIGRSADELIQGWNANHPDDPVVD